jgi:tRNA-splicing ligase RtcB
MEIKEKSKDIYEIPKQENMNVPSIVIADKKMLETIKKDKTLEQIKNVATLKGIIKNAIALPDCHQGYGFPIGGVAAFDIDKGVISPGGVGYDVNCLSKNSKILSSFGYYKNIECFQEDYKKEELNSLNKKEAKLIDSKIELFLKKKSDKIIKIKTESGEEILITEDHPLFTKEGMKPIKQISINEQILLYPFKGIEYEPPSKLLLISEEEIDKLDRSCNSKIQIKNKLKSLGLLPLYLDNPKIPYLIKIIGFIFGDGSLNIEKNIQTNFFGNKEDLKAIKKDLEKIGFRSHFFQRKRKHMIKTQYKEYLFERVENSLQNSSSSLAILLHLLGTPSGNKAKQDYSIPKWIMESPLWYKRLFLAAFFGAELSSPRTNTYSKFTIDCPVISINKEHIEHGFNFISSLMRLLYEFNVKSGLIKDRIDQVNGKICHRSRIIIYNDNKNLINLYSKINYEYNIKKRKLANAAICWLNQKQRIVDLRNNALIQARKMKKEGFTKKQIIENISEEYINKYFLDKAIYKQDYGKTGSRIAYKFISFNEFLEKNCFGEEGFVWDRIILKKEEEYNDWVYDFTLNNNQHNFFANSFVVSNCSVRLLKTNLEKKQILEKQKQITDLLYKKIPSGVGRGSSFNISFKELDKLLEKGAKYFVEKGFGEKEDYLLTEEQGCMEEADSTKVSERAKKRGIGQLGTIGAGNHFLEVQYVEEIFDEEAAKVFGLKKNQIMIMIHCGSRGLGHQVASDYIKIMEDEYGFEGLADRELINAPIKSEIGKNYYKAMCSAANFAFANKQLITYWLREAIKEIFPESNINVVYDVCHNIAKFEEHFIDGKLKKVLVCRKGATRSFGEGRKEIPEMYRKIGQPVIIPGSMGTSSYLLLGTKKAEELTFGSSVHGAGRTTRRTSSLKNLDGKKIKQELREKGIEIEAGDIYSLAEEAPQSYKDVDEVVEIVNSLGINKKVARMKPLIVIKG